MRWNKNDQFSVENLFTFKVTEPQEAIDYFNLGIKNKIVASHQMNSASSRSHCIFSIKIEVMDHNNTDDVIVSKLQLVDLAGSERTSLTGNVGVAQKESVDINQSLLCLRKVIQGLADQSKTKKHIHIPYRESKLTSLLKQSLGGNSYTLMIACLAPNDKYIEENISTLNYATKASSIKLQPKKNEDPKTRYINQLKKKIVSLEKELAAANDHITFLTDLTGDGGDVSGYGDGGQVEGAEGENK